MKRLDYIPFPELVRRRKRRRVICKVIKRVLLTASLLAMAAAGMVFLMKSVEPDEASAAVGKIETETEGYREVAEADVSVTLGSVEMTETTVLVREERTEAEESAVPAETEPAMEYLGRFKISHYCCEKRRHICGTGTGLTSSGLPVQPGMIATDPRVIPTGSKVMINGVEYTACDTGGSIKGNRIDIAVDTHRHALELGVYEADVYLITD